MINNAYHSIGPEKMEKTKKGGGPKGKIPKGTPKEKA